MSVIWSVSIYTKFVSNFPRGRESKYFGGNSVNDYEL